ncbi:uncharacterized protein LOC116845482 [Odontomachus brunneus]|uniref:uncharacterized protein LOC116845482 n=1 Tax=Odontomachus brunneus TaxID=486640 RepID=UPI0013F19804|nr:uncharacterized protein LOC116845482 [Odontomachus brunneus]XP_032674113.1 uncharacterized protein LOC116845482 [Odontomachus brunneus]
MPAEIDTGGPRVLHCDSRADCPTTPISAGQQRRAAHSSCRSANSLADLGRDSAARLPRIHGPVKSPNRLDSRGDRQNPKGPRRDREIDTHADDEEPAEALNGRDVLAKSRASTQPPPRPTRGGNGLTCLAPEGVSRALENASKDECLSVTRDSREGARNTRYKVERAESRLAIAADTSGRAIARRRSLQDRSWTRPLLRAGQRPDTNPSRDSIDRPSGTRAAGGSPLLSSHHSRSCSKVRSCEDNTDDTSEGFPGERLAVAAGDDDDDEDSRADGNARSPRWPGRDERLKEEIQAGRTGSARKDPTSRKRRGRACRGHSFLRLAVLLFLVTFGQSGLFGRSVRKFSAGPSRVSVLTIGTTMMIGAVSAAPVDLLGDAGNRAERSANLSHITGTSRKIQMYVKNRHLQILPDGTVNGSNDDTSEYTIFQRISVSRGQLRIRSMATCLYLCMDVCGLLYGAREHTDECVFNENLEQHNYNTYSSVRWSTKKKTMYLGLNRYGQPRRVQTKGEANLGRLSAYARVLTRAAPLDRVEALQRQILGSKHNVRHRHHDRTPRGQHGDVAQQQPNCPPLPMQEKDGRDKFRCRKRKKRKKRKRRCRQGEQPGPQCQLPEDSGVGARSEATDADASPETTSHVVGCTTPESKRSCEGAASEEACRRQALSVPAKKRKSRIDCDPTAAVVVVDRNFTRNGKNKAPTSNAKKPNVGGDSQSKKPDLTDGKKKKRKRPATTQTRGSAASPTSSQKQYALGTTSSQASSSLTAPPASKVRASTASSSSSPSPPGASTAPSVKRVASSKSGRKKPPSSSSSSSSPPQSPRNGIARPSVGSRRVGKSFSGTAGSIGQARSTPSATTPSSEAAHRSPPSTTKVPETTTKPPLPSSSPAPTSSLPWQKSAEDISGSLSDFSLVDEEASSSFAASEVTTGTTESTTSTASSEIVTDLTTFRLLKKDGEDSGSGADDVVLRATTSFPFDRLAM